MHNYDAQNAEWVHKSPCHLRLNDSRIEGAPQLG